MWLQFWLRGLHIDKVTYAIRVVVIATVLDVHSLFLGLFLTWLLWLTLGLMGCKNNKVDEFNTSAFCEYTLRPHQPFMSSSSVFCWSSSISFGIFSRFSCSTSLCRCFNVKLSADDIRISPFLHSSSLILMKKCWSSTESSNISESVLEMQTTFVKHDVHELGLFGA